MRNPCPKSGQSLVTQITLKVHEINISDRAHVTLEWSPGHSGKGQGQYVYYIPYATVGNLALERGRKMFLPPPSPWLKPQIAKFTHSFDNALPGKHTLEIYNGKSHDEAATLCQLRSGMCKPNKYLARIGAIEEDACSCGRESESVDHFLFRCPLWLDQRRNICRLASKSNRWGDLSFALGVGRKKQKMGTGLSGGPLLRWSRLQSSLL